MKFDRFSVIVVSIVFVLALAGCSRQQEKPVTASSPAVNQVATATTVLATIADDEKPQAVAAPAGHAAPPASQNQPAYFQVIFSETGKGVAYIAEKNDKVYVVHNNSRGKEYSVVGKIALSSDGRRIAYGAIVGGKWRVVIDGREGAPYNTVKTPMFSPEGQHIAYQAMKGEKWYIVVDDTPNSGTNGNYTKHQFNADSTLIAYIENQANNKGVRLIISDLRSGRQHVKASIGNLLVSNKDKTRLAAMQIVDSKPRVIDFSFAEPEVVREGRLYDAIDQLTFGDDCVSVSYVAVKGTERLLVLNNREEPLPDGNPLEMPVIRPDQKGAGILMAGQKGVFLHQFFLNTGENEKMYDEATSLIYSGDGRFYAYAARKGQSWFVVVNGKEGPDFDRVVSPILSPDGKKLVYRARKDEKRFVVIADTNGKTIKQLPAYEQVFQPVFTPDGKSVAYGVKDGNKLTWVVENLP